MNLLYLRRLSYPVSPRNDSTQQPGYKATNLGVILNYFFFQLPSIPL